MLTLGQFEHEVKRIKVDIVAALEAAGYKPDWSCGFRVDGHYVSVEINRFGRADRWVVRDALQKVEEKKLSENDVPCAQTIEVVTGDYRHSRTRVRRKNDGSIDLQKIVDRIIKTVEERKNAAEAQQVREVNRDHMLSVLRPVFDFTNEPSYFSLKNGHMEANYNGSFVAEGVLDGFTTEEINMLARAGKLTFKLVIDGDKLTTEVVTLLKARLGVEEDEEAA